MDKIVNVGRYANQLSLLLEPARAVSGAAFLRGCESSSQPTAARIRLLAAAGPRPTKPQRSRGDTRRPQCIAADRKPQGAAGVTHASGNCTRFCIGVHKCPPLKQQFKDYGTPYLTQSLPVCLPMSRFRCRRKTSSAAFEHRPLVCLWCALFFDASAVGDMAAASLPCVLCREALARC